MNAFDISKYEVNQPAQSTSGFEQQENPINESFDISRYEIKPAQSTTSEGLRHLARTGSRIAETIAGFPGDVVQFVKGMSKKLPKPPEFLQKEPNIIQRKGKELLEKLPTSEDLKKYSSYLTSGFTDPQSAEEQFGDEITSLATSLAVPGKDPTKFKNLLKAIGTASAAKGAKKGAELLGAGEGGQMAAEAGTLLLTGFLGNRYPEEFIKNQYQKAYSSVPQGTMLYSNQLVNDLTQTKNVLSKGLPKTSQTKTKALSTLEELENKAIGGAMPLEDLTESYRDINESLSSKKLFDDLSTTERKLLRSRYEMIKKDIDSTLKSYGQQNPDFYNEWKKANAAYSTLAQAKSAKDFILRNIKTIPGHLATSMAMKMFLGMPYLAAAGAGVGAYQAGKVLSRMAFNPSLRQYYLQTMTGALNENMPALIKNMNRMEKEMKKEKLNEEFNQNFPSIE